MTDPTLFSIWLDGATFLSPTEKIEIHKACADPSAVETYAIGGKHGGWDGGPWSAGTRSGGKMVRRDRLRQLLDYARAYDETDVRRRIEGWKARGISFAGYADADYPEALRAMDAPPYAIYYRGSLPPVWPPGIAVVGSRRASAYGRRVAQEIAQALSRLGVPLISGMASGIDGIAQMSALESGGYSLGILGCGVANCYPPQNRRLFERLIESGGLMSEYLPETMPRPAFFPARNRLISAMAAGVVVVEAGARSGSLITLDLALDQGRDVYVVPGRITDPMSTGCNARISQGAEVICSVEGFAQMIAEKYEIRKKPANRASKRNQKKILATTENLVYSTLDLLPKSFDDILRETKADAVILRNVLTELEIEGLIEEVGKGYYRLI